MFATQYLPYIIVESTFRKPLPFRSKINIGIHRCNGLISWNSIFKGVSNLIKIRCVLGRSCNSYQSIYKHLHNVMCPVASPWEALLPHKLWDRRGRDRMLVGFIITTYVISAYHH